MRKTLNAVLGDTLKAGQYYPSLDVSGDTATKVQAKLVEEGLLLPNQDATFQHAWLHDHVNPHTLKKVASSLKDQVKVARTALVSERVKPAVRCENIGNVLEKVEGPASYSARP